MAPVLLYFDSYKRKHAIGTHQEYCEQIRKRVFPLFENIEQESEEFAEQEYDRLGMAWGENGDMSDAAELAGERGIDHYEALSFASTQIVNSAFASVYHLWEKTIKVFLIKEFEHYQLTPEGKRSILKAVFEDIISAIESSGYDIRNQPFFKDMDKCRLAANTIKHGLGASAKTLKQIDERLYKLLSENEEWKWIEDVDFSQGYVAPEFLSYDEHLNYMRKYFDDFSKAIEEFWKKMPERLYYPAGNP